MNGPAAKLKTRLLGRPKAKIVRWIAGSLAAHAREAQQAGFCATLSPAAEIAPEGRIENGSGDAARIAVGGGSLILGKLLVFPHGGRITVGDGCYVGHRSEIWAMESVQIGNRVLISHNVSITDNTAHSLDAQERHRHHTRSVSGDTPRSWDELPGVSAAPVVIEDDVWISFGVSILKGVRIGAGSVIAAGSLVTKDVPPGVLYRCEVTPIIRPLRAG